MKHEATFFSAVSGAPWDDIGPLARLLEVELSPESSAVTPAHAQALWKELSYLGSNDLAYLLRGFEGVDYPEIVRDAAKHLKLSELQPGEEERVVEHNEQLVLAKIFADAWEHLDADQRRELLRELNLDGGHLSLAGSAVADAVLAGKAGPFAIYKLSRIVANSAARSLPARGLARGRRKTAQAVVWVASLRQAKRTALAETALAEVETATDVPAERAAPRRRGQGSEVRGRGKKKRRTARKKTASGQTTPGARKKKSIQPKRATAKKAVAQKTVAKKKATVKKATVKRAAKKQ